MNQISFRTIVKSTLLLVLPFAVSIASVERCHALVRAYVTNQAANSVSVINTVEQTATEDTLYRQASFNGPYGVAVAPAADYYYVVNRTGNNLFQVTTAGRYLATHITGLDPVGVAVSPDSTYAYVTNHGDASFTAIHVTDGSIERIPLINDNHYVATPFGVAIHPGGNLLYVTDDSSDKLLVVNLTTKQVTSVVRVGNLPKGVAVTASGSYVVVANSQGNSVSIISTASDNAEHPFIPIIGQDPPEGQERVIDVKPFGVAITPNDKYAYVTNTDDDSVTVIDLNTRTTIKTIPVGDGPMGISVTPNGKYVYAVNNLDNTVSVIDTTNNRVLPDVIPVGAAPVGFGSFIGGPKLAAPTNLSAVLIGDNTIQLNWSDNSKVELGFKIERRKYQGAYSLIAEVGPDVTSYTDPGLDFNANYSYRVYAYNDEGGTDYANVAYSTSSSKVTVEAEKSGCFIATAAYGSMMEPQVQLLRAFRDRFLTGNLLGRAFVRFYYENSPPVARYIAEHDNLRTLVRWGLLPLVGLSWLSLTFGLLPLLLAVFLLPGLVVAGATLLYLKKRGRRRETI